MKSLAGFVAFVIVWSLLQWLGSTYFFKDMYDAFPNKFSWLLWFGGITMVLSVGADKIVTEIQKQLK